MCTLCFTSGQDSWEPRHHSYCSVGVCIMCAFVMAHTPLNPCRDVQEYARVGPPVLYVVQGFPVASQADISAVCGSAGCDEDSLVSRIALAAQHPTSTFVGSPAASWIDDFFAWVSPELPSCCRKFTKGSPLHSTLRSVPQSKAQRDAISSGK
jgi:hypothetical protein